MSGSRMKLPPNAQKVCASCLKPRGNVSRGWGKIIRQDAVVGWTCPDCPEAHEPIRRRETKRGVTFRAVVDATPHGATKRVQASKVSTTLEEARAWVEEVRTEIEAGREYARSRTETVDELCDRWLNSRRDTHTVTRLGYGYWLAPVRRYIGDMEVTRVTLRDVENLVHWLETEGGRPKRQGQKPQGLGPRTMKGILSTLGQVFDLAVREETVTRNVIRLARPSKQKKVVGKDLEHWSPEELMSFRRTADADALAGAWRLTLCGLTRADVMGLRWKDVDLEAGSVTVSQGRVQLSSGDTPIDEPKSPQRLRTVPVEAIHPGTVELLRKLRAKQAEDRLAAGEAWQDSGLVVVDELGRGLRPATYSQRFWKLCDEGGHRRIRLHSVRHSLAFWLHSVGVSPADAAAFLGHRVDVYLSTYLPKSGDDGVARAALRLSEAMSQTSAPSKDTAPAALAVK